MRAPPSILACRRCCPTFEARFRSAYDTRTLLVVAAWLTVGVTSAKAIRTAARARVGFNISRLPFGCDAERWGIDQRELPRVAGTLLLLAADRSRARLDR